MLSATVTGGCGFIGSHIVEYLVGEEFKINVIDDLSRASDESYRRVSRLDNVEVRIVDVRDFDKILEALSGEVVFHLAALTDIGESESEKRMYYEVNVIGTRNVVEAASKKKIRVIYASSASVYGELDKPAVETQTPKPLNYYGYTKLEAEKICLEHVDEVDATVLRLFNVYGERARAGVIKNFIESAFSKKPLQVYGDGESVRDFVYVKDVAEAFYKAYSVEGSAGKIINIGSGKPVKIKQLAEYVSAIAGTGITYCEPRINEVRYSVADISYAEKILSWKPKNDLFRWISEKLRKQST